MSLVTFLQRLATMQTGEELGGHMSGADAVDVLSYAIEEARQLIATEPREALTADGLTVLATCRGLLDEALLTHIYQDESEIGPDCAYVAAIAEADGILGLQPAG